MKTDFGNLGSVGEFGCAPIQPGKAMRNEHVINFSSSKETLLLTLYHLCQLYIIKHLKRNY